MIYSNTGAGAVYAMERARLGEPEDPPDEYCPVCGAVNPDRFYVMNDNLECAGCSECIHGRDTLR